MVLNKINEYDSYVPAHTKGYWKNIYFYHFGYMNSEGSSNTNFLYSFIFILNTKRAMFIGKYCNKLDMTMNLLSDNIIYLDIYRYVV